MKLFPYCAVIVFKNEPWAIQIHKLDGLDFERVQLLKELVDRTYEKFKKTKPCNAGGCHEDCCRRHCQKCNGTGEIPYYGE